jgi:hypothetical protein
MKPISDLLFKHGLNLIYGSLALVLLACLLLNKEAAWAQSDGLNFHSAYIDAVSTQGFLAAMKDPKAAMPPLFHLFAAICSKSFQISPYAAGTAISFASTLLLLLTVSRYSMRHQVLEHVRWPMLFILMLSWPLMSASLSPVTDSFGLLLYTLIILCLIKQKLWPLVFLVPSILFTRQYYVVLLVALIFALPMRLLLADRFGQNLRDFASLITIGVVIVLSVVVVAFIHFSWGGMVPEKFTVMYSTPDVLNLGAIALALAYIGTIVALHLALKAYSMKRSSYVFGAILGGIFFVILPTDYNFKEGRWGSVFWQIAEAQKDIGLNFLFATCFWLSASFFFQQIREHKDLGINCQSALMLIITLGIIGVFALQPFSWQRYIDPMLGIAVSVYIAMTARANSSAAALHRRFQTEAVREPIASGA